MKTNRPTNDRQHIYIQFYIFTQIPEQNCNSGVTQNYNPTGCPITDMYNIDRISDNKDRTKPVDIQNNSPTECPKTDMYNIVQGI